MFDQSRYRADRTTLAPGETLALCSDGVTEAENRAGEPFDEAGLERVIEAHPDTSATELGAAVMSAVEAHARATKLADDLTIFIVRRLDRPVGPTS